MPGQPGDHDKNGNRDIIVEHVDMNVADFLEYIFLILIRILRLPLCLSLRLSLRLILILP